jgi:dephospho-CoA kinase
MAAVVGITGGIASGKSTVSRELASRLNADLFDADLSARSHLARPEVVELVGGRISPDLVLSNGQIDRRRLRDLIYDDPQARRELEGILHPLIRHDWSELANQARNLARPLLVDIPLLFETSAESAFDCVITVACDPSVQLDRMVRGRGIPMQLAEKMIASQLPLAVKMAASDHVVWSEGPLEALPDQIEIFSRLFHDRYR